jgi:tryptophan-rich sensory protein
MTKQPESSNFNNKNNKRPALPKKWIVPIKLTVMTALAGCSAFLYFNVRDLQTTEIIILLSVVLVCAMVWMDCKMSESYWAKQEKSGS